MRSWILKIHMYGGLLCASYLIIFGFSSLNFNHHFVSNAVTTVTWERPLVVQPQSDARGMTEAVRDSLGLMGWPVPWETRREDNGNVYVSLSRPAKKYRIHILFDKGRVEVEEQRRSALTAVNALHALGNVPGSNFLGYWRVYTEICVWVVLFSACSGIYLWTARRSERIVGYGLLSAAALTLFFMVYLWGWG